MAQWGEGYKDGYRAGAMKALRRFRADLNDLQRIGKVAFLMGQIGKTEDGAPSQYAVSCKGCGGVDAHQPGCR